MRKINKYSYNLKECDHEIWYILQEFENDGIEKYKYIAICLDCGKVIYEDRWEIPLPNYYIKSEITLEDGTILFIPYEQIKRDFDKIKAECDEEDEDYYYNIYNSLNELYGQQ